MQKFLEEYPRYEWWISGGVNFDQIEKDLEQVKEKIQNIN